VKPRKRKEEKMADHFTVLSIVPPQDPTKRNLHDVKQDRKKTIARGFDELVMFHVATSTLPWRPTSTLLCAVVIIECR